MAKWLRVRLGTKWLWFRVPLQSLKLIQLQKSPSLALIREILKLKASKDIKQHVLSTTVTESQMTLKHLKNVSTKLAVVSTVRKVGSKGYFQLKEIFRNLYLPLIRSTMLGTIRIIKHI